MDPKLVAEVAMKSVSIDVTPTGTTYNNKLKAKKIWVAKNKKDDGFLVPTLSGAPCQASVWHENYNVHYELSQRFTVEAHVLDPQQGAMIRNKFKAFGKRSKFRLTDGAKKILTLPNAGGNSVWSEVMSFEILSNMFYGKLLKTEMELMYWPQGCKITDYSMELFETTVGVSVTRAMKYNGTFDEVDAKNLLTKKLGGVNESSKCVIPEHSWKSQILHVWATHDYIADQLEKTWETLSPELKSNTMVVVTVVNNAGWIFREDHDDEELFQKETVFQQ